MASAAGIGVLVYSAYIWSLTGDPLTWLKLHAAWGRRYTGLWFVVGARYAFISEQGWQLYMSNLHHDLLNALGVIFVLAAAWPVARRFGLAYGVFILITATDASATPVPQADYTFSTLKMAQALGDFDALVAADREVVHYHIDDPAADHAQALARVLRALS